MTGLRVPAGAGRPDPAAPDDAAQLPEAAPGLGAAPDSGAGSAGRAEPDGSAGPGGPGGPGGSARSSAPGARLGIIGWLRWSWRQLTSMRTALVLLFLLAVASVPGSVLPQQGVDPAAVSQYYAAHPALAPLLAKFSLFSVFGAPWFAAIYLLLFLSLAGCVLPRTLRLAGAARQPPHPTRRRRGRWRRLGSRGKGIPAGSRQPAVPSCAARAAGVGRAGRHLRVQGQPAAGGRPGVR